jgi:hypothetical protein
VKGEGTGKPADELLLLDPRRSNRIVAPRRKGDGEREKKRKRNARRRRRRKRKGGAVLPDEVKLPPSVTALGLVPYPDRFVMKGWGAYCSRLPPFPSDGCYLNKVVVPETDTLLECDSMRFFSHNFVIRLKEVGNEERFCVDLRC